MGTACSVVTYYAELASESVAAGADAADDSIAHLNKLEAGKLDRKPFREYVHYTYDSLGYKLPVPDFTSEPAVLR